MMVTQGLAVNSVPLWMATHPQRALDTIHQFLQAAESGPPAMGRLDPTAKKPDKPPMSRYTAKLAVNDCCGIIITS